MLSAQNVRVNLEKRPGRPTPFVDFAWSKYWPVLSASMEKSTQERERSVIGQLVAEWGSTRIDQIKREDVDLWKARLTSKVGPWTVIKYTGRCKHLFKQAEEWGYVSRSPAGHLKKGRLPEGRIRWLTEDQRALIMREASPVLRAYILMSRGSGERRGAVCMLQRKHVDFDENVIIYPAEITKTKRTHRAPITKQLGPLLDELGVRDMGPEEYVLPHVYPSSVSRAFRKLCRRLGIKDFRFHDLLHDGCSAMGRKGKNLKEIMDYRGHTDARSSIRYTHLSTDHLRDALDDAL